MNNEPTEETVQKTIDAAEVSKEELVDGRTSLGKRLKALEDSQKEIQKILAEHKKRIDECSIQR